MHSFIDSKVIKLEELEESFVAVGKKDDSKMGVCGTCNRTDNNNEYPADSWMWVFYCHACESINVHFPQDLMSGCENTTPLVVFKEKP